MMIVVVILLQLLSGTAFCQQDTSKIEWLEPPVVNYYQLFNYPESNYTRDGKLFTGVDTLYLSVTLSDSAYKIEIKVFYLIGLKTRLLMNFMKSGNLYGDVHFSKEGIIGQVSRYYDSGALRFLSYFENGVRKIPDFYFREDGSLSAIYHMRDEDAMTIQRFYPNGKLSSVEKRLTDDFWGPFNWYSYFENGQFAGYWYFNQGRQTYKYFHEDGSIRFKGDYIDSFLYAVGKHEEWHPNGKLKSLIFYEEGKTFDKANIKTGTWKYYNENGKLTHKLKYLHNKVVFEKVYKKSIE